MTASLHFSMNCIQYIDVINSFVELRSQNWVNGFFRKPTFLIIYCHLSVPYLFPSTSLSSVRKLEGFLRDNFHFKLSWWLNYDQVLITILLWLQKNWPPAHTHTHRNRFCLECQRFFRIIVWSSTTLSRITKITSCLTLIYIFCF